MINVRLGNIFETKMDVLVNTVNCVGVMGKGIALQYKKLYPEMFNEYKTLCNENLIQTGKLYPYYYKENLKVLNFPTKDHWRSPSKMEYIINGLDWFVSNYNILGISSIAFPPLGCGNGGLSWDEVGPLMYNKLKDLPIDIEIYAPFGTEKNKLTSEYLSKNITINQVKGVFHNKINDNWLLVLQLVKHLEESEYNIKVGRTIFQKICYVLSRYGTDMDLKFKKGTYGPYSEDVKNMIMVLSNNNLIIEKEYGKMILIKVTNQFSIDRSKYSQRDIININRTFELFRRVKDTSQAELVTTIIFSFDTLVERYGIVTENMIYDYIIDWKERYNNEQSEIQIREFAKYLTTLKIIRPDYSKDYKSDCLF